MVPRSRSVRGDRLRKTITRYQSWLGTLCAQLNIAVFPPRLSSVDEAIVTFERRIAPASVFHVALITRRPRERASAYVLTCCDENISRAPWGFEQGESRARNWNKKWRSKNCGSIVERAVECNRTRVTLRSN